MRTSLLNAMLAVALVGIACSDDTTGPVTSWTASLSGSEEVPAVSTTATGTATFQLNPAGTQITYTVTVTGLSGSASASHIHLAARGSTAGPNTNLCGGTGVPACATGTSGQLVTGTVAVPAATVTAIRNYGAYVNVHTSANPGGEIRGQLFPVVP